jgi:hypothetical protein
MPTNTYTPIASVTLSATASEVVFSGLPQTYRDLIVVANASISSDDLGKIQFNGDTGSNYSSVVMFGDGTNRVSEAFTTTHIWTYRIGTTNRGTGILQIMDYAQTNKHKTVLARVGEAGRMVSATAGRWANTNAITSFSWTPQGGNWTAGSTFTIFGVIA